MLRIKDITAKFSYADNQWQQLMDELFLHMTEAATPPPFVRQKAGSILSAINACFDYCARDIRDHYMPNKKARRIYFPFNTKTLDQHYRDLYFSHRRLHKHLSNLVSMMERRTLIQPGHNLGETC